MKKKKENKHAKYGSETGSHLVPYLILLIIVPAVLYFRVVNFGYTGQDDGTIVTNINGSGENKIDLTDAFTHDAFMSKTGDVYYRPMQNISLMTDAMIGGQQPWIYHLTNLLLHILTVIALFFFLKKTGIKQEIAFFISIFFSINPMLSNAVAWIPARGDLLLCLFSLLSFITFIEYLKNNKTPYFVLHSIAFLLGVFSKEIAAVLPFLLLLYYYFILNKKFKSKEIIPFLAVWITSFALFFYMRRTVVKLNMDEGTYGIIPLLKNLPAIPITFGKFFFPYNLSTLPLFSTASLIIGLSAAIAFTVFAIKYIRGNERIVLWGVIWFLAFTIPPMLIRTFNSDIGFEYFEYRAYIPIIGILIIIGLLSEEILKKFTLNKILKTAIPVLLIYCVISFNYTTVFFDPVSYYTSAIKADSRNAMSYNSRGKVELYSNNFESAIYDFDKAIEICPIYSEPYFNKGVLYYTNRDHEKAEQLYSTALKYDTLYPEEKGQIEMTYIYLAVEKMLLKKYDETITILSKAISKYPDKGNLYVDLGMAYSYSGKYDSALIAYNRANGKEDDPSYFNSRGIAKQHLKDYKGALEDFNTAIRMNPSLGEAFYNRGKIYSEMNKQTEAEQDWIAARKLGYNELPGENKERK